MTPPPEHRCQVFGSPWAGVHGTRIDSARHYGRHTHATYGFGLLEQGAQRSASGRGRVDAHAGDLITTNPGEVHDGQPLDGPSRRWRMVYVDADVFSSIHGEPAGSVEFTRPVIQDGALRNALQRLLDRLERWHLGRRMNGAATLAFEESLVETCTLLLQRHATASPLRESDADVALVRERLADDLLEVPSLGELAAMTGLSKYQLLRRFEKTYGLPPHAWLLQQRIERARGLIRAGASLSSAAASVGFSDQSHMTRLFTRQFGFTPGAWRRAMASPAPLGRELRT